MQGFRRNINTGRIGCAVILKLLNFDTPIELTSRSIIVLEVHNKKIFSRIVQSLLSEEAEDSIEPYLLLSCENEILRPKGALSILPDPFHMPIRDRASLGVLLTRMEEEIQKDSELQDSFRKLHGMLNAKISEFDGIFYGDYSLGIEWDVRKYLKTFNFGVDGQQEITLLDRGINFLEFYADVKSTTPLVLVNFKNFFDDDELEILLDKAFFLGLKLLLIESVPADICSFLEQKIVISDNFLESAEKLSVGEPSCSEGKPPSGFRAVSF